jgi:hypothetical protein
MPPLKVRKFRRRIAVVMIPLLKKPLKVRKPKRVAVTMIRTQAQTKRPIRKKIVLTTTILLLATVVMMRRRKSLPKPRLQLSLRLLSQMPTLVRQNCSSKDFLMTQMTRLWVEPFRSMVLWQSVNFFIIKVKLLSSMSPMMKPRQLLLI